MLEHLFANKRGPGVYPRSQLRLMLFGSADPTASLWHRQPIASVVLPAELVAFSRATFAVVPPALPTGGAAPLPAEVAQEVGKFLHTAAKVRRRAGRLHPSTGAGRNLTDGMCCRRGRAPPGTQDMAVWFQDMCRNRARYRRRLRHLVPSLDALQELVPRAGPRPRRRGARDRNGARPPGRSGCRRAGWLAV